MRPISLEFEGFTAFRKRCEIDFSKFDLFAITGPTGAGKTSILDAMTYALYGKTSRLSKAGRDLVSQGAKSMDVQLHFRVGAEEYRVRRAILGAAATARLEKRERGKWKNTETNLARVNKEIQRIIGLDFGGFTKTVILPQGKFDAFLRGEPKERREVLSELLDVDVYRRMTKLANERAKEAEIRTDEREANVDAAATLEAKAEREQQLGGLSGQERASTTLSDKLRQLLPDALTLRDRRTSLTVSQGQLQAATTRSVEDREAASNAKAMMEIQAGTVEDLDRLIESTPYDGDAHLRLNALLPQAQQWRTLKDQLTGKRKERERREVDRPDAERDAQKALELLDAAGARVREADGLRRCAESVFKDLRTNRGSADGIQQIIDDLENARKEADGVSAIREQSRQWEARAEALTTEAETACKNIEQARAGLRESEIVYELLHARDRGAALRHGLKPGDACPVCEQTVNRVPEASDAGNFAKSRGLVAQVKAELQKAQDGLHKLHLEAQGIPGKRELALKQIEMRESRVEQAKSRADKILSDPAADAIPALRALIDRIRARELDAQLTQERYESVVKQQGAAVSALQNAEHKKQLIEAGISSIAGQIESCELELGVLGEVLHSAPALEEITAQISALEAAKKRRAELEPRRKTLEFALRQAEKAVVQCGQSSAGLDAERTKREETIQSLCEDIAKREMQMVTALGDIALSETPDEAAQIQRMEQSNRKELEARQAAVQKCQLGIDDLAKRIERNKGLRAEVERLKTESALYRELGTWLNAGNFQEYLLSSAGETLAQEGSKHLKELSGGRYEFTYEGDEFMVSDRSNAGETRSTKTLSGGESFVASLALALALAESITQLSGERGSVNLESLFLDEGFSTLDSEMLSKVADAIELLQNGHRLIGIITHVQSLADQMPAQIEIEKSVSGSRVAQPRESAKRKLDGSASTAA
jgi:exonuclease SbcC